MAEPRSIVTALLRSPGHAERGEQRELVLTIANGAHAGAATRFSGEALLLGSSSKCGLVIEDPSVSRHHARIELRGEELAIVDLGSTNGTRVNGVAVRATLTQRRRGLGGVLSAQCLCEYDRVTSTTD